MAMGADSGARADGASSLRQRRVHPGDMTGLAGDVRGGAPASGRDVYYADPPHKPKQRFPLLGMVRDWCWRIGTPFWGALGFSVMEPNEWVLVASLYLIVLLGLAVGVLKLPSYLHLALKRMHYYITGE